MKCRLCGLNEAEKEVHFKIRWLNFDFVNQTNKCGRCVKGEFIHIMKIKDEQGCHFIALKNGEIQVNWPLYRKWYKESCYYHAIPIVHHVFKEMTQMLERLGVVSFDSGWNTERKMYNNYDSGMRIDREPIYLTRQEDCIELWRLRQEENEQDPEYNIRNR